MTRGGRPSGSGDAPDERNARRVQFMGVPLDALTMQETVDRVVKQIESGRAHQHVVLNAAKIVQAADDPELRRIIQTCDLVSADGMSVVWASRLLGCPVPERVNGTNLMEELLELAA